MSSNSGELPRSQLLVTGASGYIGSNLIPYLRSQGETVRAFGRKALPGMEDIWIAGDITDAQAIRGVLAGVDKIIHLACLPMGNCAKDPAACVAVNVQGTLNLLEACKAIEISQFVYLSTAQVYGYPVRLPIDEDHPTNPRSVYAASKLAGEHLVQAYANAAGLSATILRLFNVYGWADISSSAIHQRSTVESIFIRQALAGRPLTIEAHPMEARDFIHITDVVRAIHAAVRRKGQAERLNIGSGQMITLGALASEVLRLCGKEIQPNVSSYLHPPLQLQADITQAKQMLEFVPAVSLSAGLQQLIRIYQEKFG
ncbi:MAG: NAD-dependent epimerase/dehydratase family protein [Anaerolineae bacterium]|nr:MAG: NAD-dependent epimerase/dehydratase family protein [Anaerolineae bacterium]